MLAVGAALYAAFAGRSGTVAVAPPPTEFVVAEHCCDIEWLRRPECRDLCGYAIVFSTSPMVALYRRCRRWIESLLTMFFAFAGIRMLLSRI